MNYYRNLIFICQYKFQKFVDGLSFLLIVFYTPNFFLCFSGTGMYTEQAAFILFFHALCVRGDFLMVYDKVSFTGISGHGCPRKPASDTDVRCRRSRPLSNPPPTL